MCSTTITEGSATMIIPESQESAVFYNPVQVQNRDLSILMIALAVERSSTTNKSTSFHILDALAASGLRSIRYWNEIEGITHITINDLDPAAVERARRNVEHNSPSHQVSSRNERGIRIRQGDALHLMYNSRALSSSQTHTAAAATTTDTTTTATAITEPEWDVIDLDPYGSAAPFVDAAIQAIAPHGLLCVTCTDMAALGGSHPETCFGRYGAMPIQRAGYLQEVAIRILLGSVAQTAAKYGRTIHPILSVGMDFYVRVFVQINKDKAGVQNLSLHMGHVYQSTHCPSFHIVPIGQLGGRKGNVYQAGRAPSTCTETGSALKVGGPLWLGPMHDKDVAAEALRRLQQSPEDDTIKPAMKYLATRKRLQGLLLSCQEELDTPLYYKVQDLAQTLHVTCPPLQQFKAALVNAGYRVSGYHKEPQAVKTDAPNQIVWDIMRAWYKTNPPKTSPSDGSVAAKIVATEPSIEVDFTVPKDFGRRQSPGIARFPQNPQAHWGPKPKASGVNQNKKRKAANSPSVEND